MKRSRLGRRKSGFALVDTLLAAFIISVGAVGLVSILPTFSRSQRMSQDNTFAMQIATKELENLRMVGFESMTYSSLYSLGLVSGVNADGTWSFSNIAQDQSTHFSAASALKNGSASLSVDEPIANVKRVVVTVSWSTPKGQAQSISMTGFIGRKV